MSDNLTTKNAAALLGISPWTLVKWRSLNKGPAFVRFYSRVRYRRADLLAFMAENTVSADAG